MSRPAAGYVGFRRTPTQAAASGIWSLREAESAQRAAIWPTGAADPFFNSVSLLLQLDGANGSTTFTDSSSSPKTVSAVNAASISTTQSQFGGASAFFSGTTSALSIPYSASLDFGAGDFTMEWWQYWTGGNSIFCWSSDYRIGILANYGAATSDKMALCLSSTGSTWNMAQPDTNNSTFAGSSVAAAKNVWQHIALQRTGNTFQLFFDGTRVINYTAAGTIASSSGLTFRIGGPWPGLGPTNFQGYIDSFRITKGVARYSTSGNFTAPAAPHPVVGGDPSWSTVRMLLKMEGGTTTFTDVASTATVTANGSATQSSTQAKFGSRSLLLSSSSDWLSVAASGFNVGTGDVTAEAWIYPTSNATAYRHVFDTRTADTNGFALGLDSSNRVFLFSNNAFQVQAGSVSLNQWSHVAMCRSNGVTRVFLNGTQVGSDWSNTVSLTQTTLLIGKYYAATPAYPFIGHIDEVRWSNAARYTTAFDVPTTEFPT